MAFTFTSFEHGVASFFSKVYTEAKAVEVAIAKIAPVLKKEEPVIEAVASMLPGGALISVIDRAAFAALGILVSAAQKTEAAASDATIKVDASTLAEFKELAASYKDDLNKIEALFKNGQTAPVSVPSVEDVPVAA